MSSHHFRAKNKTIISKWPLTFSHRTACHLYFKCSFKSIRGQTHIVAAWRRRRRPARTRFQTKLGQVLVTVGLSSDFWVTCFDCTSPPLPILPVVSVRLSVTLPVPEIKSEMGKKSLSFLSSFLLINSCVCVTWRTSQKVAQGNWWDLDRALLFNNAWWCLIMHFQATAAENERAVLPVCKWPCRVKIAVHFPLADIKRAPALLVKYDSDMLASDIASAQILTLKHWVFMKSCLQGQKESLSLMQQRGDDKLCGSDATFFETQTFL